MNGQTLQRKLVVVGAEGLHLRPATAFVDCARRFQCAVSVRKDDKCVDGKVSPLELLLLLPLQGSELTVEATGPDAPEALQALVQLLATWEVVGPETVPNSPATG